jgi:hypothetical protein
VDGLWPEGRRGEDEPREGVQRTGISRVQTGPFLTADWSTHLQASCFRVGRLVGASTGASSTRHAVCRTTGWAVRRGRCGRRWGCRKEREWRREELRRVVPFGRNDWAVQKEGQRRKKAAGARARTEAEAVGGGGLDGCAACTRQQGSEGFSCGCAHEGCVSVRQGQCQPAGADAGAGAVCLVLRCCRANEAQRRDADGLQQDARGKGRWRRRGRMDGSGRRQQTATDSDGQENRKKRISYQVGKDGRSEKGNKRV